MENISRFVEFARKLLAFITSFDFVITMDPKLPEKENVSRRDHENFSYYL